MSSSINKIRLSDGGDGSTFVEISFENGEALYLNPDIPYEGEVTYLIQNNKVVEKIWPEGY